MKIDNKVVLVYGGTSGIGKELTKTLVSLGANVVFSGQNKEKGEALMELLGTDHAVFHQCDITNWSQQEEMYKVAKQYFDGKTVDIVILVAGILDSSDVIHDEEPEGSYRTLQVNLTAAIKAHRLAIQHFLRENKPGCIINTSSIYGFCGAPLAPMYSATKHAIIGLTKSYGTLLKPTKIRVNAVAPSFIETPMLTIPSKAPTAALGYVSMSSCMNAYLQILSDDSMNGEVLILTSSDTDTVVEKSRSVQVIEPKLDNLSQERQESFRQQLYSHFQIKHE
ncbi:uncharacterized protein BX664DRAFT_359634 [Halteromyces radiatus]|uniref:uncharacterized protein n=1 Tax=Halteromyces radiatus TaxID=101107 RepID=UPI00221EB80D|nr:uncharacterized protein BX664DRAFT_359634 [Halteromyces radiatus]KAI8086075.1 hypothetical protein BX664DRAFT_359634 [Halteromyces radiatus]